MVVTVAEALQKSAGKSLVYYNLSRARVYDSDPCRQLQLGASSPDVDAALRVLGEHRGTIGRRYDALREAFKTFKSDASVFRTTDEQTSAEIRDAICNDREWESKVPRIADDKVSQFRSQWDRLQAQRDRMLNEV